MGITFEYTAPGTPQQNGVVERAFATLMGRARAMMNQAGFPKIKREQLWPEAAWTATKLENILVSEGSHSFKKFYGTDLGYVKHLRVFGEIGVTMIPSNNHIRSKIEDCGCQCMFLGYADNHAGDVFRFLNLQTHRVILSRDVIWLNKLYAEHNHIERIKEINLDDDADGSETENEVQQMPPQIEQQQQPQVQVQDDQVEIPREVHRLTIWGEHPEVYLVGPGHKVEMLQTLLCSC